MSHIDTPELILDEKYNREYQQMSYMLSDNFVPSNNITNNYNNTKNSPITINITINNASMKSDQDITKIAEGLAWESKRQLAALVIA